MIVYDVTDKKSFDSVSKWVSEIDKHSDKSVKKMLVANKCEV